MKDIKVGLHLHSSWSDGSMRVPQIVKLAKLIGFDAISITDHDTMANMRTVAAEGGRQNPRVLPGVEISAFNPSTGRKIHILGYLVEDARILTDECRPYLGVRHRANLLALERVRAAGYPIDEDDVSLYIGEGGIPHRQHTMHALADRGHTPAIYGELYDRLYGPNGIAVAKSDYMPAMDAVRLIKETGGFAVLAHPFQYDSMEYPPALVSSGLNGIECWHHTQTPERQDAVKAAASKYGLFLTGGSDWHGLYSEKTIPTGTLDIRLTSDHPLMSSSIARS
ncbi:MAG: PHP domain-containing protein [Synergistaceae bacterium]|jgi:predicted metal-dependent phosphoesterase TrpH|nr:PHP domain-containing protein [Synergistaceae bacterium]